MYSLLNSVDSAFQFLPAAVRLCIYGLLLGVVSMLIYWKLSPQAKIASSKKAIAEAQAELRAYKGSDFREMLALCRRAISASSSQILLILGPTVIAALPVLAVIAWLESDYSHQFPQAGNSVNATFVASKLSNTQRLIWPTTGASIELADPSSGKTILTLPLKRAVADVYRSSRLRGLVEGHDRSELAPETTCSHVEFDLPRRQVLSFGPNWMRSWEVTFFAAMSVAALAMKFILKIH